MCEAMEELMEEQNKRRALVMLADKVLSIELIAKYCNLTVEEVTALEAKRKNHAPAAC